MRPKVGFACRSSARRRCKSGSCWVDTLPPNPTACEMTALRAQLRPQYLAYVARREAMRMWLRYSRDRGKRPLTVFDPSLRAFNGHHMEFAQLIKEECGSEFDVRFYVNFRAETKLIWSLPAQPISHDGIYPPLGDFDDIYRTMTASTVRALNRMDSEDVSSKAILIMHTVTLYQLGGVAQWFSALPKSRRPQLCIQFQFPLEFRLPGEITVRERAIGLARAAANRLMATGRTRLASNSELLASHISEQLEQPCAVLPLPIRWPDFHTILPEQDIVFGFFGALRPEKGASIMAEAIPAFAARYPDTRFLVHAPRGDSDSSAVSALESVPQVELIYGNFARKVDYFRQFTRASCILLPYDPVEYAYRTSGILIEALGLDRLVITTKDSWLYTEAERRKGRVISMADFTPAAFLSSLCAAHDYLSGQVTTKPTTNYNVIKDNSPAAFCSALIRLARSA
jgi:hypothetical protein